MVILVARLVVAELLRITLNAIRRERERRG